MESSNPLFGANTMDQKKYSEMEAKITKKMNELFSEVVDDEKKKKGERARTNFDPKIIEFAIRNKLQNESAEEIYRAYVQSKEDAAQAEMDAFYDAAPEPEPEQETGRVEKAAAAAAEGFKKFMGSLTGKAELKSKKRRKTRKRKSKKKRSKKRKRSSRKSKTKRRR